MTALVQQSTTQLALKFFLTATSDHIAGLTGATATVTIRKEGGTFGTPAGAVTEIANGWYQVAGNATDTNTLGQILLHATAASADPFDGPVAMVVAFNPQTANLGLSNVPVSVAQWNGTNVATPATAGVPQVNVSAINNVAATSVTAVNANQGTTQPVNFTGTAGTAYVKSDMVDVAGAAVSTTTAQLGVNAVQINAVATTAVTAVNANQGTTQPINFTGTAAAALTKSDMVDVAGAAVSATTAQIGTNVVNWNNTVVATPATAGIPDINVKNMNNVAATSITTIAANQGTTQPINFTGTAASALVKGDTVDIAGSAVSATTAQLGVNVVNWNNTVVATPATAGIPDINVKNMNNVAATSITTIAANQGTTQPINFTGTGATAYAKVDVTDWTAVAAPALVAGHLDTNISLWNGTAVATPATAGIPKVDVQLWRGAALAGSIPPDSIFSRMGNAQAGGASSITLDASASATNNLYNGSTISIDSGTGFSQTNIITAYNGSTKVATVGSAWATVPDATSVFIISAFGPSAATVTGTVAANVTQWNGTNVAAPATAGVPQVNVAAINNVAATSVTTVNANQGTTQPINFTGTGASALAKSDMVDVAGSAVSATTAQLGVNVVNWNNTVVATPAAAGIPDVNIKNINNVSTAAVTTIAANQGTTQPINFTGTGVSALTKADMVDVAGAAVSTSVAQIGVNTVNIAGSAAALDANNRLKVDVDDWGGTAVGAVPIDAIFIRSGTAQAGAATTITLDASASATNNLYQNCSIFIRSGTGAGQSAVIASYVGSSKVATIAGTWATNPDATSVFTIAAFGPVQATIGGTVSANVIQWNGTNVAVPATAGIPDVNTKNLGNTSQTGRDVGASVLLSAGTGTGQLDFTSGVVKSNLVQILATALTETAGQLAAGFKQFFNIGSPTSTMNTITTVTTATNLTNAPANGDLTATMKTSVENAVWNATQASHVAVGSTGESLNVAGTTGDPWLTTIPGAYTAGTAGHRLGNVPDAVAGAAGGLFIAGTNAPTTITTALTTNITGNLSGSVGSVTAGVNATQWGGTNVGSVPPDTIFARSGTAQAGAATTITLDAGASAVNNLYNNCTIFIRSGTGAGQTNIIIGYVGSTKVATVGSTWATNPDATSVFTIADLGPSTATVSGTVNADVVQWGGTAVGAIPPDAIFLRSGTAQGGGAGTITLDAGASATNNLYQNCDIFIRSGTGAMQSAVIASYVGATKVATITGSWGINPDATSVFTIAAFGPVQATVGGTVNANVIQWNGGSVPAPATAGIPDVNVKNWTNTAAVISAGLPSVNTTKVGGTVQTGADLGTMLTTQLTESYAPNGTAPTAAQALFAIQQMLTDFAISGTSITVQKLDHATTAFVVTLNDATSPTSAQRL